MRAIYWKAAIVIAGGITLGAFGGQATIAGLVPAIAPAPSYRLERLPAEPYAEANPELADYARIADECDGCSDYDLGYRFAAARRVTVTADCMDYSWSYQRGCLAYLRKG